MKTILLFAALLLLGPALHGADGPPDLAGSQFKVQLSVGEKQVDDKLTFKTKELHFPGAGITLPFTAAGGPKTKDKTTTFSGELVLAGGEKVSIQGSIKEDDVSGAIIRTPAKGEAQRITFTGRRVGAPDPKKK